MRISDWSSDVCSSDLYVRGTVRGTVRGVGRRRRNLAFGFHQSRVGQAQGRLPEYGRVPESATVAASTREGARAARSEEHTSELQSLMRISYAVFCLKKKKDTLLSTLVNRLIHRTATIQMRRL